MRDSGRQAAIPPHTKDGVLIDDLMTPICAEGPETRWKCSAFRAQLEWGKNVMRCLLSPLLTV